MYVRIFVEHDYLLPEIKETKPLIVLDFVNFVELATIKISQKPPNVNMD